MALNANSHLVEYIALGCALLQCCIMLFQSHDQLEVKLLLYVLVLANLLINNHYRGTRIHLYPLCAGFALYSLALFFEFLEEIAFYYYYLMTLVSLMLVYFFGTLDYYNKFELSGRHAVGAQVTNTKTGNNKVLIYYPTDKNDRKVYPDLRWAMDGDHILKGLQKFSAGLIP